ncbi:MAG: M48 family metalloprotease, partial [Vicinamibacterales bacterium]
AQARLMPLAFSAVLVPAQIIAFARFEAGGPESAGPLLIGTALLGLVFLVDAIVSGVRSWHQTRVVIATWRAAASPLTLPGWARRAWSIERKFPVVAVVGIGRPELFVATEVADQCSTEELAAIVAHETAHVTSHDNLVRLLFRLTPGVRIASAIGDPLEHAWMVAAEQAADAQARGSATGLDLASALTKVARLAAACECEALPASALIGGAELQSRVRRLLEPPVAECGFRMAWAPLALLAAATIALYATPALTSLHELFELFVRR